MDKYNMIYSIVKMILIFDGPKMMLIIVCDVKRKSQKAQARKSRYLNIISIQVKPVVFIVEDLCRVLVTSIASHIISQH